MSPNNLLEPGIAMNWTFSMRPMPIGFAISTEMGASMRGLQQLAVQIAHRLAGNAETFALRC